MASFPRIDAGNDVTRQVLSESPDLMVVEFRFEKVGAEGTMHSHPHVQSTYVKSGKYRFFLSDKVIEIGPGDSFIIPSNVEHGCLCLEPGVLIDSFTPRRDDFL